MGYLPPISRCRSSLAHPQFDHPWSHPSPKETMVDVGNEQFIIGTYWDHGIGLLNFGGMGLVKNGGQHVMKPSMWKLWLGSNGIYSQLEHGWRGFEWDFRSCWLVTYLLVSKHGLLENPLFGSLRWLLLVAFWHLECREFIILSFPISQVTVGSEALQSFRHCKWV